MPPPSMPSPKAKRSSMFTRSTMIASKCGWPVAGMPKYTPTLPPLLLPTDCRSRKRHEQSSHHCRRQPRFGRAHVLGETMVRPMTLLLILAGILGACAIIVLAMVLIHRRFERDPARSKRRGHIDGRDD